MPDTDHNKVITVNTVTSKSELASPPIKYDLDDSLLNSNSSYISVSPNVTVSSNSVSPSTVNSDCNLVESREQLPSSSNASTPTPSLPVTLPFQSNHLELKYSNPKPLSTNFPNISTPSNPINYHLPPNPLPDYIKIHEKIFHKGHLYCHICDIYVNSQAQLNQHNKSIRHLNIEKGIAVPPRPKDILAAQQNVHRSKHSSGSHRIVLDKQASNKTDANDSLLTSGNLTSPSSSLVESSNHYHKQPIAYKCTLCNIILNSNVQLNQHLKSNRHLAILNGKQPKPRWMPYHKYQQEKLNQKILLHNKIIQNRLNLVNTINAAQANLGATAIASGCLAAGVPSSPIATPTPQLPLVTNGLAPTSNFPTPNTAINLPATLLNPALTPSIPNQVTLVSYPEAGNNVYLIQPNQPQYLLIDGNNLNGAVNLSSGLNLREFDPRF